MKVEGSYTFRATKERVWDLLLSPEVLSGCIPGCQAFEPTGDDAYDITMRVGVSAVSGTYTGKVRIDNKKHLESYKMVVEGKGSGGAVRGEGVLSFSQSGGTTQVHIAGDASVSGIIARVGQRLLGSTSKMLMNQFFECLRSKVE